MKKLLALILCVVMVMSLAPMAFAEGTTGGVAIGYLVDRWPNYMATGDAKAIIKDLNKDINAMYYAITTDEVVYASAKGIYDFTDSLAKDLVKGIDKFEFRDGKIVYEDDLASNLRKGLNRIIGDEIANYMNDRIGTWTDSTTGRVKADKYLDTYVKALNKTLGSEKAQKNLQAIMLGVYAMTTQKSINDRADDLYEEIDAWDKWKEFGWGDVTDPSYNNYVSGWKPIVNGSAATDVDGDGVPDIGSAVLVPTGSNDAYEDAWASWAYPMLHG